MSPARSAGQVLLALLLILGLGAAGAAEGPAVWPESLSGRLARIKETRRVQIGYRQAAVPFSYVGAGGRPVGYTLDLCAAVVAAIGDELGGQPLAVDYVPVTPQDRIERVESGAVDLECGATTNTALRGQRVAFSPVIFITGTRLAVPQDSAIRSLGDLRGKPVAVVRGTTNEAALRELDRLHRLGVGFVLAQDYRETLSLLDTGEAMAIAADDVLLRGLLVEMKAPAKVRLVGDLFSFEPYGIMLPGNDPALQAVVRRAMRSLAESRDIVALYNRWFVRPLPSGGRMDLPMSPQLRRAFELIGLPAQ